ncbi:LysR family transcriptional regulator [Agrococcus baldri]|uniref:LysR family transcriptional regulator n=1 Tax=Agrococcus baldri TaxID=153730 RepID=A0AA87UT21_9MICO|nr:LysR family transcriptional regulator [Agrococcus baldri]
MGLMNTVDLRRVDLNLLVVFQVLCQERHVTRAALKLNLSQSAVSAALSRLRALFDDPLFVRSREGMTPTPKALAISSRVAPTLSSIVDLIFDDVAFDPQRTARVFHLAMSDDIEMVFAPWLMAQKIREGWSVEFAIHQTNSTLWRESLADPRVDLVVCGAQPEPHAASYQSEPLFSGRYLCLFDAEALGCDGPMSSQAYLDADHVRVSFDLQRGWVDDRMAAMGLTRRTLCTISHFAGLGSLLRGVAAVATIPEHAARAISTATGLATSPVPIESPRFSVSASWSTRADSAPETAWLRAVLKRFAETT